MTNNTHISLHPSSPMRNDALNSIKYTLLLKYEVPHPKDKSDLIPEVMKSCQKCCHGLFTDNDNPKIYFDFFGSRPYSNNAASLKEHTCQLSFLDEFPPNKDFYPDMGEFGFPTMILDHCVLSCYHAVLTELMDSKTVTAYEIINSINYQGIHSLNKKGILDFQPELTINKRASHVEKNSTKSSTASDFGRKAESHIHIKEKSPIKALSSTKYLFKEAEDNKTNGFFLQFAAIFQHLCNIDVRSWQFLSSDNRKKTALDILEKFENLSQELFPVGENYSQDPVDKLYGYYITERISNVNLVTCLLKNTAFIEKEIGPILQLRDVLDMLCLCQKLPNIFSRQYFVRYAIEKLIDKPISYLDFWNDHRLDMSTSVLESSSKSDHLFHFLRWPEQVSSFFNYMAEYVIPIYEWCFTNMLMDAIEHTDTDFTNTYKKTDNKDSIHRANLLTAYDVLSEYIQRNHKKIISPVPLPKKLDTLRFATETKDSVKHLDIPVDTIQQLFQLCFSDENLDLNLRQLNPDFFLTKRNNPENKNGNFRHIRNFYINLLYPG